MAIDISARFDFHLDHPGDVLLQFEAAAIPEQVVLASQTRMPRALHAARVPAQDLIGERIWLRAEGQLDVHYEARVEVERLLADLSMLDRLPPHQLPGEAVPYLFDSRYCQAMRLHSFIEAEFGGLDGGARVLAMRDWIRQAFTYEPGHSTSETSALDSFVERRGVCRDYAHVMVTLARAAAIPARYVSCYAPGVEPQDFHAVAEVFLADPALPGTGTWHLVDATGMADAEHTVKIGVGRDAADVSFLTCFTHTSYGGHEVQVSLVP